nr:hypothetical protein GZ17F1_17 [uncultured archaeon GZfos17F1]
MRFTPPECGVGQILQDARYLTPQQLLRHTRQRSRDRQRPQVLEQSKVKNL